MKTKSLKEVSTQLAVAGVEHVLVRGRQQASAGSIRYQDNPEAFADTAVEALSSQAAEGNEAAVLQGQVLDFVLPFFKQFNGKKITKTYLDKIKTAADAWAKKADLVEAVTLYSSKNIASGITFYVYYQGNRRREFTFYYKTDAEGKLDYQKTLDDNKSLYNNIRDAYTKARSTGIDKKQLRQDLIQLYKIADKIAGSAGHYFSSVGGLIDFLHRS